MQVVLFYGPPACGKGTHAVKLSEITNWPIIDAGKEFRTIISTQNTPLAKRLKIAFDDEKPVLTEDYLRVISSIIENYITMKQSFIMDRGGALPAEAKYISNLLEKNSIQLSFFHLPLTLNESIQRSLERYFVPGVNNGFQSYETALEHCPIGVIPVKRDDDTSKKKITNRYTNMYSSHMAQVLSIYSKNTICNMYEIASNHTIDESFTLIQSKLQL